jgi:hypothetical protein
VSLFRCTACGCVDNTGLTNYWQREREQLPLLCAACDPEIGQWHGHFPQRSALGLLVDKAGHLWHPRNIMSMPSTYTIVGIVQEQGPHPLWNRDRY